MPSSNLLSMRGRIGDSSQNPLPLASSLGRSRRSLLPRPESQALPPRRALASPSPVPNWDALLRCWGRSSAMPRFFFTSTLTPLKGQGL